MSERGSGEKVPRKSARARARSVPARMAQSWRLAARLVSARPLASLRGNVSISSPTLSLSLSLRSLSLPAHPRSEALWDGAAPSGTPQPRSLSHPARLDGRAGKPLSSSSDRDRPTIPSRPLPTSPPLRSLPARALTSSPQPNPAEQSGTITVAAAAMPNAAAVCHFASGRSFGRSL